MPKRLKFVVEQWVLFMVRRQTWQVRQFEIFESAHHFRIELNRDVRFEFESNLEASQVSKLSVLLCSVKYSIPPLFITTCTNCNNNNNNNKITNNNICIYYINQYTTASSLYLITVTCYSCQTTNTDNNYDDYNGSVKTRTQVCRHIRK